MSFSVQAYPYYHKLTVTTETAKEAFARAVGWHVNPSPKENQYRVVAAEKLMSSHPNMYRDGEAQRCVGREGAYETHVRAHRAQLSSTPLCQRLNVIMTGWLGLIQIVHNPYRPELHYMRGPNPKWYAKYQGRTEKGHL